MLVAILVVALGAAAVLAEMAVNVKEVRGQGATAWVFYPTVTATRLTVNLYSNMQFSWSRIGSCVDETWQ